MKAIEMVVCYDVHSKDTAVYLEGRLFTDDLIDWKELAGFLNGKAITLQHRNVYLLATEWPYRLEEVTTRLPS